MRLSDISKGSFEYFRGAKKRVMAYLETCREPQGECGRYVISPGNPPDLFASCYAVFIRNLFDELGSVSRKQRDEWSGVINSVQREDGYFDDPVNRYQEWRGNEGEKNLLLQTGLALSALTLLGRMPRQPLIFLDPVMNIQGINGWFDERRRNALSHGGSWGESISVQNLGVCLVWQARQEGIDPYSWPVLNKYFETLEELQDPKTGFWGTRRPRGSLSHRLRELVGLRRNRNPSIVGTAQLISKGMGTTFHMVDTYAWLGRQWRHGQRMVDHTLLCQHEDGLFNPQGGGGQCWDLDAVSLLANLLFVTEYRREGIRAALTRVLNAFVEMKLQNQDGGFRNTATGEPYQKGKSSLVVSQGASDMFSTWFRCMVLAIIDAVMHPDNPVLSSWRFDEWGYIHLYQRSGKKDRL